MGVRFGAYVDAVRRNLMAPLFGGLDGLVVLADLLSALHQGQSAFADTQDTLYRGADLRMSQATSSSRLLCFRCRKRSQPTSAASRQSQFDSHITCGHA